jgi:hypothetical protein
MASTPDHAMVPPATGPAPLSRDDVGQSSGLQFAALIEVEKETFKAGLRSRILTRLFEAAKAPTAHEYRRVRDQHLGVYCSLTVVLRAEGGVAPVTDAVVMRALDRVERDLGESWRHRMEHAINVSQSALKLAARMDERSDGAVIPPHGAMVFDLRWFAGWNRLNWAVDSVFVATEQRVMVQPEVVEAVFEDLCEAADDVYVVASEVFDARFGNPDEDDE